MTKRNYWPLFFIGIFAFTLAMIIWTIVSAVNTPVHEDKSFLNTYQKIDESFNDMMTSNDEFNSKYDITFYLNDKPFSLDTKDIYLSQRVLDEKPTHKNYFNVGKNILVVKISDKNGNSVDSVVNFKVTKATNNYSDIDLSNSESKSLTFDFDVSQAGNWNLTGTIESGNSKGYFFIKSNANSK